MPESTNPEGQAPESNPAQPPKSEYACAIPDLKPLIQLLVSDTTDFNTITVLSGVEQKAFSLLKAGPRVHLTFVTFYRGPVRAKIADFLLQKQIKHLHAWRVAGDYEMSAYEMPCDEDALFSLCQTLLTTVFALPENGKLRVKFY
jgi:hypothetical protein